MNVFNNFPKFSVYGDWYKVVIGSAILPDYARQDDYHQL